MRRCFSGLIRLPRLLLPLALLLLSAAAAFPADTLFERAKNLYDVREYKMALVCFQKVIESEPENGEAWDFASWCHRYNGDWDAALKGFARAKELLPGDLSKWVAVGEGETYLSAGLYPRAVKSFTDAISLAPEDEELAVRATKGAAFAYAALGDKASMEQAIAGLGEKFPDSAGGIKDAIKKEADALLLKAQERTQRIRETLGDAAPAVSEDARITDADQRLAETIETRDAAPQSADTEAPAESGTAESGAGVAAPQSADAKPDMPKEWQLRAELGDAIGDVLEGLNGEGVIASKADVASPEGLWLYSLSFPSGLEPPTFFADKKPVSKNVRMEEFDGKLLAVIVQNSWENVDQSVALKDQLFADAVLKLNAGMGSLGRTERENALRSEAQWISPVEEILVLLTVSASLEGNVTMEVTGYDFPGFEAWVKRKGI